jgi:hypothetical protein
MENVERSEQTERGQVLVIMAFGIVVLLIVAGLAVDGGTVLMERRHAQNAADAASLAGARLLAGAICDDPNADDAAILAEVRKLAEDNDVRNPATSAAAEYVDQNEVVLGTVGGGSIPVGSTGVSVTIDVTRTTYLMMLIGIDKSAASAHALAMTGPIIRFSGGGMLPIGVPLDVVEAMEPGDDFYIIDNKDGAFCRESDDLCIGDPSDANSKRGWLNFNYIYNTAFNDDAHRWYRTFERNVANRGCGGDPSTPTDDGLQGWASGQCPYPLPIFAGAVNELDGDFIHGSPGARQAALHEIEDNLLGQVGYVPIFDFIYTADWMDDNMPDPDDIGWPMAGGGGSAYLYHIVGFAAARLDDVNGHKLEGEFQNATIGKGVFAPSAGYGNGACDAMQVYGVALWR